MPGEPYGVQPAVRQQGFPPMARSVESSELPAKTRRRTAIFVSIGFLVLAAALGYLVAQEWPRLRWKWKGGGIRTLDDGTVHHVIAAGSQFTDADVIELRHFPELKSLTLRASHVTDDGVRQLAQVRRLQTLDLSGTQVTDAGLRYLAEHGTLSEILLQDCPQMSIDGLLELRRITGLRLLSLGRLPLDGVDFRRLQDAFPNTTIVLDAAALACDAPGLKAVWNQSPTGQPTTFHVQVDSAIDRQALRAFRAPELVTALDVVGAHGRLLGEAFLELPRFSQLTRLNLQEQRVTDEGLRQICHLRALTHLKINAGTFGDDALRELHQLDQLNDLWLVSEGVRGPGVEVLKQLPRLQRAVLKFPNCEPAALEVLFRLTSLTRLRYWGGNLHDEQLKHLPQLTELTTLDLYGNPLTDTVVPQLEALPRLTGINVRGSLISETQLRRLADLVVSRRQAQQDAPTRPPMTTPLEKEPAGELRELGT